MLFEISYSQGGTTGYVEANCPLEAIIKDYERSGCKKKVDFFVTYPNIDPCHFIVKCKESTTYFRMIPRD